MKKFYSILLALTLIGAAEPYSTASPEQVDARVEDSKKRLEQTEGGKLLWESIKAHGGQKQWFSNGLFFFRWTYHMDDAGLTKDTSQTIDTWSARARHEGHGDLEGITFGWDGKKAWISPEDADLGFPASFWALTPYYFVGVPHVLADPGTIHEKLADQISLDGNNYDQVKVTYKSGTGESPDDYYITLIDPQTKLVKGVRYIVTSPLVLKGRKPVEKLLTYEGWHKVSGIFLPKSHRTFVMDGDIIGKQIRSAEVSDARFLGEQKISFEHK